MAQQQRIWIHFFKPQTHHLDSSSPPSWLPIFKHALPGARRADPKPRGRQPRRAGERRPSEHLPPPSGHALGSGSGSAGLGRRSTRSVEAEAGGSLGTVSAVQKRRWSHNCAQYESKGKRWLASSFILYCLYFLCLCLFFPAVIC